MHCVVYLNTNTKINQNYVKACFHIVLVFTASFQKTGKSIIYKQKGLTNTHMHYKNDASIE